MKIKNYNTAVILHICIYTQHALHIYAQERHCSNYITDNVIFYFDTQLHDGYFQFKPTNKLLHAHLTASEL